MPAQPVTKGLGWTMVAAVVGSVAAVGALHAQFVVPSVLLECRKIILEEMGRHENRHGLDTHALQRELEGIRDQMKSLATQEQMEGLSGRMDRMEAEITRLRERLDKLKGR